ncbi:MAG: MATE family efflux transporter [Desulfococcaceae bacterium]|jgi:MATE family multidrug resistance protein|nr:MATE family efflux transporter [Desulfococcaceae bacterium]
MLSRQYREVLRVSLPLVAGTSTTMVMEFTDRVFLSHYSLTAIAAAMPGGIAAFLFISFFMGIAGYVSVFIAQYIGASARKRVGSALWQGIYFSLFSGILLAGLWFIAVPLFRLGGHPPEVQAEEVVYFRILCLGGGWNVLQLCLSSFYSGLGKTRPVMLVNILGMLLNIPLNYALINGLWIFPELGIAGAGIATVTAWFFMTLLFSFLIFTPENDRKFGVRRHRKWDRKLFARLIRFGGPGGMQFSMDIFAFTFFIFMLGRIGKNELAVSSMVFSVNSLAFMPMLGFSIGTSILVGQTIGKKQPEEAVLITRTTLHIAWVYVFFTAFLFLFLPEEILRLFHVQEYENAEDISRLGSVLLRFVVCYIFFDANYMILIGALKGAGDTRFIMWSLGLASLLVMVLPLWIGIIFFRAGIYYAWTCCTLFIFSLFSLSLWRYRQGKWKEMRIIE